MREPLVMELIVTDKRTVGWGGVGWWYDIVQGRRSTTAIGEKMALGFLWWWPFSTSVTFEFSNVTIQYLQH